MRVCSFVPAATSIIYELGLQDLLCGVTFECPAEADKPRVVRSALEGQQLTSAEIDRLASDAAREGRSLYSIDLDLLRRLAPDLIITQSVCDVCQIGTSSVERAIAGLDRAPRIIALAPHTLEDVYSDCRAIAGALGHEEAAGVLLARLQQRTDAVLDRLRAHRAPLRRVLVLEWLDPLYNCGHWIPYQIAQAGGVDMLANPGGYSVPLAWERVRRYDPEVIVAAPCGFGIARVRQEVDALARQPGWAELAAATGHVYLAGADLFTRPSATLVDGIELLAALFHPALFDVPARLREHVLPLADALASAGSGRSTAGAAR
jgi:iron complex transport system substrate-binding protein